MGERTKKGEHERHEADKNTAIEWYKKAAEQGDASDINKYLKDIAIYCHIDKNITFHTSRHTFASTVTLANNISLEVVSKMLGHTNTRMTTHYAKLLDKCISEQMDSITDIYKNDSNNNE